VTLTELLTTLYTQGHIRPSRIYDIKASTRHLAAALGKESPDHCLEDEFNIPERDWKDQLDRYLGSLPKTPSAHMVRNTRHNIRFLLRTAAQHALLAPCVSPPPRSSTRKDDDTRFARTSPYRQHREDTKTPYALKRAQWPADIQDAWEHYCTDRQLTIRQSTLTYYTSSLQHYMGFLTNVEGLSVCWHDLFDPTLIDRFVRWHSRRSHKRLTRYAHLMVGVLHAIAHHLNHPHHTAISAYRRRLPTPEPLHAPQHHQISLHDLETVGLTELREAHKPIASVHPSYAKRTGHPRLKRAIQHQRALILRLMVRMPLRVRNFHEMQFERNLYQDQQTHWCVYFRGDELKVATRSGRLNTYHIDLTEHCPELIPHLEEFLLTYRPLLPQAETTPYVFLTKRGEPYTSAKLSTELTSCVFRRTNKRFYPHRIRKIWPTEYIEDTGDIATAASMLGDTVQVVLQHYYEPLEKHHQKKASQFLAKTLAPAKS
jgi:hypothetical protein